MPRVSQQAKELNRRKILDAASVMFRERGADQVGIDQLMHSAGLTRGGFYNHFESKETLVAEACRRAFAAALDELDGFLSTAASTPSDVHPLVQIAQRYLSVDHRDAPGRGCPMATLGVDVGRHSALAQRQYAEGTQAYLRLFMQVLDESPTDVGTGRAKAQSRTGQRDRAADEAAGQARAAAMRTLTSLVGAMVLARAVREAEPALSDEFLAVGRDTVTGITEAAC